MDTQPISAANSQTSSDSNTSLPDNTSTGEQSIDTNASLSRKKRSVSHHSVDRSPSPADLIHIQQSVEDHCRRFNCFIADGDTGRYVGLNTADTEAAALTLPKVGILSQIYLSAVRQGLGVSHAAALLELEMNILRTLAKIDVQSGSSRSAHALFVRCFSGEDLAITPLIRWLVERCYQGCQSSKLKPVKDDSKTTNIHRVKRYSWEKKKPVAPPPPPPPAVQCVSQARVHANPGGPSEYNYGYNAVPPDQSCFWMTEIPEGLTEAQRDILCADAYEGFILHPHRPVPTAFVKHVKAEFCPRYIYDPLREEVFAKAERCRTRDNIPGFTMLNDVSDWFKKNDPNNVPCKGHNNAQERKDLTIYCEGKTSAWPDQNRWWALLKKADANTFQKYEHKKPNYCPAPLVDEDECLRVLSRYPHEGHQEVRSQLQYYQKAFNHTTCSELMRKHRSHHLPTTPAPVTTPTTTKTTTTLPKTTQLVPKLPEQPSSTTATPNTTFVPDFCQETSARDGYSWLAVPDRLTCQFLDAECAQQGARCDVSCTDLYNQASNHKLPPTQTFTAHFTKEVCQDFDLARWLQTKEAQYLCGRYSEDFKDIKTGGLAGTSAIRNANWWVKQGVKTIPQSIEDKFKQSAADGSKVCEEINELFYDAFDQASLCINGTLTGEVKVAYAREWHDVVDLAKKSYLPSQPPDYCAEDWHASDVHCGNEVSVNTTKIHHFPNSYRQAVCAESQLNLSLCNGTQSIDSVPTMPNSGSANATTPDIRANTTTPDSGPTPPTVQTPALSKTSTSNLVAGSISLALTGALNFYPTMRKEIGNFSENRKSLKKMTHSTLNMLSASGFLASPTLLMASMPMASSVAAAVGSTAMVCQLPFVALDWMDYNNKQDQSFKDKKGSATRYCRKNMELDTGTSLAFEGARAGVQTLWMAEHIMNVFGTGIAAPLPIKLVFYYPTLVTLILKANLRAFQHVEFNNMFAPEVTEQMQPLIALSRMVEKIPEDFVTALIELLDQGSILKYQLGGAKLTDEQEKLFLMRFFENQDIANEELLKINAVLLKIYTYQLAAAEKKIAQIEDKDTQAVLRLILSSRVEDKGYFRSQRGNISANSVYEKCIASIVKLIALRENREDIGDIEVESLANASLICDDGSEHGEIENLDDDVLADVAALGTFQKYQGKDVHMDSDTESEDDDEQLITTTKSKSDDQSLMTGIELKRYGRRNSPNGSRQHLSM